jgi:hypothetical protein
MRLTKTGTGRTDEEQKSDAEKQDSPDVELSEEGQDEVHQMMEAYQDKPTAVLPGSHGTITGTAINDWLDDEGNPKFGDPDEHPFADGEDENGGEKPKEPAEEG